MLFQQSIELKFILLLFRLPVGFSKDLYAAIADAPPSSFPYDIILLSNCDIMLTRPRSTGDKVPTRLVHTCQGLCQSENLSSLSFPL
jgi:hypothetical protein